ncbi:hypothetical protein WS67_05470 [Burkholderia singularis]|uniref:Uncharacterized protein n=1 Tax=Burkholderia singularis TaxID=1503053 RepID=A0A118DQD0_9BURK|nr:hypothetical protein WS67_05470 [Burkholderia singularis]
MRIHATPRAATAAACAGRMKAIEKSSAFAQPAGKWIDTASKRHQRANPDYAEPRSYQNQVHDRIYCW